MVYLVQTNEDISSTILSLYLKLSSAYDNTGWQKVSPVLRLQIRGIKVRKRIIGK